MPHSYTIHERQCRELFEKREEQKPEKERRKLGANPFASRGGKKGMNASDVDEMNTSISETWKDSLPKCKFCGRSFADDKLRIHNKVRIKEF